MEPNFTIKGLVIKAETKEPIEGLFVRVYDRDLLFDDLVGTATTGANGEFTIVYSKSDFSELFERNPDLYFVVSLQQDKRPIHTTVGAVAWDADNDEEVCIAIPARKLPQRELIQLLTADGIAVSSFEAGETLMLSTSGLKPNQSHQIQLSDEHGREILSVSLVSNRYGVIAPTVIWPDMGIGVPGKGGKYAHATYEEAMKALGGRSIGLALTDGKEIVRKATVRFAEKFSRPKLFPTDDQGVLKRGLLLGRDDLIVAGHLFPAGVMVDVYLVPRRNGWLVGERFAPAKDSGGKEIRQTVRLSKYDRNFKMLLAKKDDVLAGSYDIIARVTQHGEYLRDELIVRATDIVSERLITTLVVRDDIFRYKPVKMGCVNSVEIAGKMLWGVPEEFEPTNNFPLGTDVWAALDPAGLMPEAIGKKVRYAVIAHKDEAGWLGDSSLDDVTGTVTEVITSHSCVNANAALVWSNPMEEGKYDLVVDFGNNAADPADFAADDSFDPPNDMIDGYFTVGFHVTKDPSLPGTYPVGRTSYYEASVTIPATGVWCPPDWDEDGVRGDTMDGTLTMPLMGEVRYPADMAGSDVAVSADKTDYPLVIIMHGQNDFEISSYLGYTYLLDHLASHGFIAVSIDCRWINMIGGMQDTRAHIMIEHIAYLNTRNSSPGLFNGKIDMSRIGIMGHSRGGDGAVMAEVLNQSLSLGWDIKAVVALAPTDFSGTTPSPLTLNTSKFLCIYGANDGDVWGGENPAIQYTGTGFRFYDRATVEKAMVFIIGATHNRFNTELGTEGKVDFSSEKLLSSSDHQNLLKGYMTAFMQIHLLDRPEQIDYFTGVLNIPSVSTVEVHCQYRPESAFVLDDFQSNHAISLNTAGGAVDHLDLHGELDGAPTEGLMEALDPHSPHQTRGIRLRWDSTSATYTSTIPVGQRNLTGAGYRYFSFRVTQRVGSASNPVDQLRDLRIRLNTSGGGPSRAIRAGYFDTIPYPYKPEYREMFDANEDPNTKSAMKTVRIPLSAWSTKCLDVPMVDLADVESVQFEFDYHDSGELEIDDIIFTQ